jgi:hypothetical protein
MGPLNSLKINANLLLQSLPIMWCIMVQAKGTNFREFIVDKTYLIQSIS